MAIVVVALDSLNVYFEGLAYRTLLRRVKVSPPLRDSDSLQFSQLASLSSHADSESVEDQDFARLVDLLELALGSQRVKGREQAIDGSLGRTEVREGRPGAA